MEGEQVGGNGANGKSDCREQELDDGWVVVMRNEWGD